MFDRLSRSWELTKASAAVLAADKELLVFPFLSGLASLLVLATFAVPTFLAARADRALFGGENGHVLGLIVVFLFYVCQYFVILFCNTALVGAALIRLRGGDPTMGDGLRIAVSRLGGILGYAVLSATVGLVLRTASRKGGVAGRAVSSFVGLGWSLATWLVVPVLVVENVGPLEAVQRSASYLKRTWGEQLAGNLGLGAVFGLMSFAVIVAGIAGTLVAATSGFGLLAAAVAGAALFALLAIALVSSALGGIYAAAVYRYAAEGEAGSFFPQQLVTGAFARS